MNKIKNVFHRSQKIKTVEERRPQQFVKRHSTAQGALTTTLQRDVDTVTPAIDFMELSEMEKPAYSSWWKDLDPFDLKRIDNQTVLKFLNGCHLEDAKLEQILALFETAGDGLTKVQFFAMLRLIAHAQNGRNISPALVYLGAPVPHFHTNAIDAIIKSSSSTSTPTSTTAITNTTNNNNNNNVSTIAQQQQKQQQQHINENMAPITTTTTTSNNNHAHTNSTTATTATATVTVTNMMMKGERKSWWGGYERRSQLDNNNNNNPNNNGNTRRSLFMGETSFIPPQTPTALFNQPQGSDTNMMDYFYPSTNPNVFSPSVQQQQQQQEHSKLNPIHTHLPYETSIPSTPSWTSPIEPKQHHSTSIISTPLPNRFSKPSTITEEKYTHGRSRSAGTASDFMQDFEHDHDDDIFSNNNNSTHVNTLQSSKSSLSLHDLHNKVDTGQSLLLTQKFVYLSPSLRNKELQPNNPFNTIATDDDDEAIDTIGSHNMVNDSELKSPFMDSIDDNPTIASHIIPENSTSTGISSSNSNRVFYQSNNKPNIHHVPPPPVPSQITKPAFPKYTRTNNYLLKRSQSTGVKKDVTTRHQRHKSTGTSAIIY